MQIETRKLLLIEEMLKIKSEATLPALENLLKRSAKDTAAKNTPILKEFSGKWSKNEAEEIERIIAESCGTIHADDWNENRYLKTI